MKISGIIMLFLVTVFVSLYAQEKRAITIEDLWKLGRIAQVAPSPDGKFLAYAVTWYDMEENKGNSDIWLLTLTNNEVRQITSSPKSDNSPVWAPDSRTLYYISSKDGSPQLYSLEIDNPAEPKALTNLCNGVSGPVISPDGKKMLFTTEVYPDCTDDNCNKAKDEAKEKNKVKAKVITGLMYRHWDSWRDEKRNHLFLLDLSSLEYKDIMQGSNADCPPIALGGKTDYSFSPDSKEICFVYNPDKAIATSTNNDLFTINTELKNLTQITKNKGNDNQPVYSPNGKYIAFRSMQRPGFEADKLNLMLYDRQTGKMTNLTEKLDQSVDEFIWSLDQSKIYFNSDWQGRKGLYSIDGKTKQIEKIYEKHWNYELNLSADGKSLVFLQNSNVSPTEIFKFEMESKQLSQLTFTNTALIEQLILNEPEEFWSIGAEGRKVHSFLVKPPNFDPVKKYPMIFLVHGGPQGAWEDNWHYRWNPQMYAAPGYVVVMTNPRGSTGYGQRFTDEISGDWGGKPYIDLINAYDYAVKNYSYIDGSRTGAAGASYGGYMMNWMATKTDRFKAFVSHAGVFNLESMYGTTEELWFPEWENKGTPWANRDLYRKFSPHEYVQNIKTPILVTHGQNDFRVPEGQAMELYTSLQRLGVPSKFILFPDETHFVSKPQNFRLWMTEIYKWFDHWFKK